MQNGRLASSIQSNHQNAHLLLAEEAGEEGGDGEGHGGSGTCNGQEQKGFGASPDLLLLRSQKTQRGKELLRKKDGCGDGSLAGVSEEAPGQRSEGLLRDWRGSSGSGVKSSAVPRHEAAAATTAAARPPQRGQIRVPAAPSPCASGASPHSLVALSGPPATYT